MKIKINTVEINLYHTAQKRNGFWYVKINQFYVYRALTLFGLAFSITKESAIH